MTGVLETDAKTTEDLREYAGHLSALVGGGDADYHVKLMRRAADEIERLRDALSCVSRMKVFPDNQVNIITLAAAIQLAEKALGS